MLGDPEGFEMITCAGVSRCFDTFPLGEPIQNRPGGIKRMAKTGTAAVERFFHRQTFQLLRTPFLIALGVFYLLVVLERCFPLFWP